MSFYNFIRNDATGDDELYIDGEIAAEESWWRNVTAPRIFRQALARVRDVTVFINSPGGDVFAGAEIYTALREHKGKVTVKISGIAASAASVIAMAGDEVLISPVGYMMIHDPWTYAIGNAREMEHQAGVLREIGEGLVAAYTAKTGKTRDEITELLAAETYMNAQRAVDEGFADGILYETPAPQPESDKAPRTLMRASRYAPAAVLAMIGKTPSAHVHACPNAIAAHTHSMNNPPPAPVTPNPEDAQRAEIAQRARMLAELYTQ